MDRKLYSGVRDPRTIAQYNRGTKKRDVILAPLREKNIISPEVKLETSGNLTEPIDKSLKAPPHEADYLDAHSQSLQNVPVYNSQLSTKGSKYSQTQYGTFFEMKPSVRKVSNNPHRPTPVLKRSALTNKDYTDRPNSSSLAQTMTNLSIESNKTDVSTLPHKSTIKRSTLKLRIGKSHILQAMASILFVFGSFVAFDGWQVNKTATEQTQVLASRTDDVVTERNNLDEEVPASSSTYKVAPDLPRILEIPSINVSTRVLQVGVNSDNSLAAPKNIHDAGWYTGSAKPNSNSGAIVMDGHVRGPMKLGVFYNLKKLKIDDEIILESGDGQRFSFKVTRLKTVPFEAVNMEEVMRSDDKNKLGLNLITCGGEFDARSNMYKSRVLVFAVKK